MKENFTKTEMLAGISSFLATIYIVVVNPAILSITGMPFNAALTSTILVCFFGSLMMGIYAKNPIIVASGMGMKAFFMLTPIKKIDWTDKAIGIPCFLAMVLIPFTFSITQGIIFGLLSWTILKILLGKIKEVSPELFIII